jgi:hypothetical protein
MLTMAIGSRSVSFKVDPLFAGGILLPASYMKSFPVAGRILHIGAIETPRGMFEVQEAQLAVSIHVGSFEFHNPVVRFGESLPMAMAGAQWLAGFSVAYDLANGRVRLGRQRSFPAVDAPLNRLRAGTRVDVDWRFRAERPDSGLVRRRTPFPIPAPPGANADAAHAAAHEQERR